MCYSPCPVLLAQIQHLTLVSQVSARAMNSQGSYEHTKNLTLNRAFQPWTSKNLSSSKMPWRKWAGAGVECQEVLWTLVDALHNAFLPTASGVQWLRGLVHHFGHSTSCLTCCSRETKESSFPISWCDYKTFLSKAVVGGVAALHPDA